MSTNGQELSPYTAIVQPQDDFSLETYERSLNEKGVRTGRHASEIGQAPPERDIKKATTHIRRVISPAFAIEPEAPFEDVIDPGEVKSKYWERARRVTAEHGATAGFELDDYFRTSESRSYYSLKQDLQKRNPEGTLGRELLDTVELYHKALDINPAHAAGIVCELVSRGRGAISSLASQHDDVSPEEATRLAFDEFMSSTVPVHITNILEVQGTGDEIANVMTKQSFYPDFEETEAKPLAVDADDVRAIIDVFDLQNRPYSRAELRMANDIAGQPDMQVAMLGVHERLIDMSTKYLHDHPERMNGDMVSWSEIFVPEMQEDGEVVLLPNPKLMKAVTNNVLPAVAGELLGRSAEVDDITSDDIARGVHTASRTYKLMQSKVGLFQAKPETGQIELGSITTVTCPANQAFPNFLLQYLGSDYDEVRALERDPK